MMNTDTPTLEARNITKSFGNVQAIRNISLTLAKGEMLGILGDNGAGKSTLMKILAGYETATSGTLLVDGHAQQFIGSRDAEAAGIVLIHQEFNLAEHLTIAQPMRELGETAARLLLQRLANPLANVPGVLLPHRLVIRGSA